MASPADNRSGVLAMLVAVAAFSFSDLLLRLASSLPTGEILAVRGLLAAMIVLAVCAMSGALRRARDLAQPLVLLRALAECGVAVLFIGALPHLPFANVTATTLASSLVATAIAALAGMEEVGWRRWSALAIGFAGVLLVLRPDSAGLAGPGLMLAVSTVLVGVRDIITKRIDPLTPTLLISLATTVAVTTLGWTMGAAGEAGWRWPSGPESLMLTGSAFFVAIGNAMIIQAFRGSDIAVVAPFRYSSILAALVIGFVIWGEIPDAVSIAGAALIVGSGLYTIWRERQRARRIAALSAGAGRP